MAGDILTPGWRREEALKKTDRRSRRTRSALTAALMELLKDKPLKNITVTELTEMADVNRATFYVHFQDVFDMFDKVKEEYCQICRELIESHREELTRYEFEGLLRDIFGYFQDNESVFSIVLDGNADASLYDDIIAVVRDECLDAIKPLEAIELLDRAQSNPPQRSHSESQTICDYHFNYLASGTVSLLKSWLAGGRREPVDLMVPIAASYIKAISLGVLRANLKLIERQEP